MTTLVGILRKPVIYVDTMGYNQFIDNRVRILSHLSIWAPSRVHSGVKSINQPVTTPTKNRAGGRAPSYLLDYYYRVHVNPAVINVGNLLSTQLKSVEVWNARFVDNTLTSIVEDATGGINLSGVASPPLVFKGLQAKTYVVDISTNGPAVIDASYSFNFSLESYIPKLSILGLRILAWFPRPNWETPLTERWEWLTNVMTSKNRKEQRVKLRAAPRRQLEYALLAKNNKERQLIENLLFAWQSRVFGLPIWTDQEFIQVQLIAGGDTIPCDTYTRDYHVDGLVGLFNEYTFEIGTISEVGDDYVRIATPLLNDWDVGTKVVPMRTARLTSKQTFTRHTDTILGMTVQFKMDEEDDNIPMVEATTYQGYSVLEVKPNWAGDITSDYSRDITMLDYLTGKVLADDTSGVPVILNQYHWLAGSRQEIHTLRSFLFARFGKLVPVWVPTFGHDLVVTDLIAESDTIMYVENVTYTRNIAQAVQRRDIRIQLVDGSIFYRRILASTEVGAKERLTFDSAIGVLVQPEEIFSVSFMSLSRLEADTVEASWETDSIMSVSAMFRTLRDDV